MLKIGFDNDKYLKMQSEYIMKRIEKFGDKLYLEFGGKLLDDYHASRVLPGFEPDSKLKMLLKLADKAEVVIVIGADSIEQNKKREDLGITYDVWDIDDCTLMPDLGTRERLIRYIRAVAPDLIISQAQISLNTTPTPASSLKG